MINEELINHKIQVDEYITMDIAIPKVMNALQFKALTMKANKLFNLSEASLDILPLKNQSAIQKRVFLSSEEQLFIMRKFVIDDIPISKIFKFFKEKFPNSEKKNGSLQTSIYNMRILNHKFYLEALNEKKQLGE